jgi:pyruvate-formate lyase-activating enzyme
MQIKGVDLLLTFKCPSKCKHCSYKAGPERTGYMELMDAERYLEELTATQPLQSVGVHGGEPFLFFEHLAQIMKKAKELNVPRRGAITNGYWAKTKAMAKKKLVELKEAGLTWITFSVDGFHQEYVPLENAKNGVGVAATLGFENVWVDSYFLVDPKSDNSYDILTREAIENLGESGKFEINRWQVRFAGRAADLAKHVKSKAEIPNGKCHLPFWISGGLENPEIIEIDFEGNVTLCPGICIGNTKTKSLAEILQEYDYLEHPILSIIAKEGPIGLLKIATAKGFKQDQKFVDECHLCYKIRKFLRRYYPRHLAPEKCY